MKNFKQFVAEIVEEPKADDEKRFKALHQVEVIDKLEYDSESIFKGDIVSKDMTRLADKHSPEDAMTYDTAYESEDLSEAAWEVKHDPHGKARGDVVIHKDGRMSHYRDGDHHDFPYVATDDEGTRYRHVSKAAANKHMKKIHESLDIVEEELNELPSGRWTYWKETGVNETKEQLSEEIEIPASHIAKHKAAGKKVFHRVLHGGKDATGKFDDYSSAKASASKHRGWLKKNGYDPTGVKVHHYVESADLSEEELNELSKKKLKDYMDKAKKNADVNFEVSTYAGSRKRMAKDAGDSERADKLDKLQKKTDSTLERRAKGLRSASRLLRAKRSVKEDISEESEELNELSKGKLKDYADKAKEDNYERFTGRGKHERPPAPASAYDKRSGARGGSRGPSKLKPSHYNKPEVKAAREKIQKKLDSRKSFIKKAEDKLKESMTLEVGIDLAEASKMKKLDKVNIVHYDASNSDATKFANDYVKGQIGDYREGGPKGADEANSEKFWMEYDIQSTRRGFAGSGTTLYTNKKTGKRFEVNRAPNGKGFHGTDHIVTVLDQGK